MSANGGSKAYEAVRSIVRTKGGRAHIDHALQLIAKDVHAAVFSDKPTEFLRAVGRLRRECERIEKDAE